MWGMLSLGTHIEAQYTYLDRGRSGRPTPDGPRQDYLLRKTTGSFQRYRDRIRPSLSRDTIVIQLGLLPYKPTRTPSCNPAPRVYKGSRGTPLDHPRSQPQHLGTTKSQTHRAILSPSIREIQPQTGRRVLPPPEGPNLSKTLHPVSSVLCYHHTCDPTIHHINLIAGNKH